MSENKESFCNDILDQPIYQHDSVPKKRKAISKINLTLEDYYVSQTSPVLLPFFTLKDREKQIYQSVTNDKHRFHMGNYAMPKSTANSCHLTLENNNDKQEKSLVLPKLTPRFNSTPTVKPFPMVTSRSISLNLDETYSMPTYRTSMKPISPPLRRSIKPRLACNPLESHPE